ncbi:Glycoprotein endo-alpha-1,2-mannosidase-like protein [Acipenser ruthenus]|uniref:Glycoprotein endo-alpha-1,2-mannosidase-like protein n=1 Tax=Acipenser ruthenus TaxID=7906 RepID=A0A444U400_ACIRT|nr:Glycoprotein endo-alpha-1,2-mannosidase-like protein [Acipenser ruthenus]
MARLRKKACVALFLFTLFIFGTMMGLRTLKPSDGFSDLAPGLKLLPVAAERMDRRSVSSEVVVSPIHVHAITDTKVVYTNSNPEGDIYYDVHIFYYTWFGTPKLDGKYIHWDHVLVPHWDPKIAASYPKGRHTPPEDIGSSFYPELGPYSSRDPDILESHMEQLRAAAAVTAILVSCMVAFHIQPYKGRTDRTVHDNIKYIIDKYGNHGAFYRFKTSTGKILPLFYIYDSYLTPPEDWANLLSSSGSHSLRKTPYDGVFISLIVEERHKDDIVSGGFDGMYTYFASNGFSFGSSHQNWKAIKTFCDINNLMFIPSVGPGYIDTSIRPWNNHNTRNRVNGKYYETSLQAALMVRPEIVTITSFNEWHEGTQIEKALPKKTLTRMYLDYLPHKPDLYLELTRKWAEQFNKEKEQWLM